MLRRAFCRKIILKSTLLSYFTLNDKAEASAEKAFAIYRNDDEKLDYLNKYAEITNLITDSKMFENESEVKLNKKDVRYAAPWFVEGQGEELATNTLEYYHLIGSKSLDLSRGSHIHIVKGKLIGYGDELSGEEHEKLNKKNPGMIYAPIKQKSVVIRFSSTANVTLKEWQLISNLGQCKCAYKGRM
ncbi:hypothetical protein GLOIN_2v1533415 [Rhizophagus irregularis DAOM 181602=DAOM 197198]|nr:hypothetical protein GLOIN_2v1533415 [Rhizophagus irregularis DAOM 181602=DAOM 197198]